MSSTILAIVLGAVLFVALGLLPERGCDGHCAGCGNSCDRYDHSGEHHVG